MEARMHPRSDNDQRCLSFTLSVSPRCRVFSYRDHLGNNVHQLRYTGRALAARDRCRGAGRATADCRRFRLLAPSRSAWDELDSLVSARAIFLKCCCPSEFAKPTRPLRCSTWRKYSTYAAATILWCLLRQLNASLYHWFDYDASRALSVNSPIDDRPRIKKGRLPGLCPHHDCVGAPCGDPLPLRERLSISRRGQWSSVRRPTQRMPGLRPFCPRWAGLGFDPTNNLLAQNRYIRTALGRDYSDVPPTRGIYRGSKDSRAVRGGEGLKIRGFAAP